MLSFIMARVTIEQLETRYAHYGLYNTWVGGGDPIVVRRKCGEPTDYIHASSRKLLYQRERLAVASRHWANLTPSQKAFYRRRMAFVSVVGSISEEKLLKGRQLFISQEIRELAVAGKQLTTPFEICIILCDEALNPLRGKLWLKWRENEEAEWETLFGDELTKGNWLFNNVKPGQFAYHPKGEAEGYIDPEGIETFMTEAELKSYHYHILLDEYYRLVLKEPWTYPEYPPEFAVVIAEPWSPIYVPPPEFEPVIEEPWSAIPFPELEAVIAEPWSAIPFPELELVIDEPWTYIPPEPVTVRFYPDKHPEQSSVDGLAYRTALNQTWADVHGGAGTTASDNAASFQIYIRAGTQADKWYQIYRVILVFDTTAIPADAQILSAKLGVRGTGKSNSWGAGFAIGVFGSYPLSNTAIVPADYGRLYAVPLSQRIAYADWNTGGWNIFTLNPAGLAKIIPGGITKLGLREYDFEAPGNAPPWLYLGAVGISGNSADEPTPERCPYLEVTYQPP